MKGRFSLNKLLHNEKLMIVLSLIAAVGIWYSVVYGPSNVETQTFNVPIQFQINNFVEQEGYQVIEKNVDTVSLTVEAPRSVLATLQASSFTVQANLGELIKAVNDYEVPLTTSKLPEGCKQVGQLNPSKVIVTCDFVQEGEYEVAVDTSALSVKDKTSSRLGTPVIDETVLKEGKVIVRGPNQVRERIAKVVAKPESAEALAETTVFTAQLMALDADGNKLDLTILNPNDLETSLQTVQVTVPVEKYREVSFTPVFQNAPTAYKDASKWMTISPSSVGLWGPPDAVDKFAEEIKNLGTVDFDKLDGSSTSLKIPLNVPTSIQVLDNTTEVDINLKLKNLDSKTLSLNLMKVDQLEILNPQSDREITSVPPQTIADIRIVGNKNTVAKIKESDLLVSIDMGDTTPDGANVIKVRIKIRNYTNAWVYYPDGGYEITATVNPK